MRNVANVLFIVTFVILFGCHQYNEDDYPPWEGPRLPEKLTVDIDNLYIFVEKNLKYETEIAVWYEFSYAGNSYNVVITSGQLPSEFIYGLIQSDVTNPLLKSTKNFVFSKFTSDGRTGVELLADEPFEIRTLVLSSIEPNAFKAPPITFGAKDITLNFVPVKTKIRLVERDSRIPSGTQEYFANYYSTESGNQYAAERINSVQFPTDGKGGIAIYKK